MAKKPPPKNQPDARAIASDTSLPYAKTPTASVAECFTASESFDVGVDLGTPVSLAYVDRAPFKFNDHISDVHSVYTA